MIGVCDGGYIREPGGGGAAAPGPAPVPLEQYEDVSAQAGPNYTVSAGKLRVRFSNKQAVSTFNWPGAKVTDQVISSFHGNATRRFDARVTAPDTVVATVSGITNLTYDMYLKVTA